MHIYFKNIRVKFHPNPIWNYEALGILKSVRLWVSSFLTEHQHSIVKITKKLNIYNRFRKNRNRDGID